MRDKEKEEEERAKAQNRQIRPLRMILQRELINTNFHAGRINLPTVGQIAAVFIDTEDGLPPNNVDLIVYPKHEPMRNMHKISKLSSQCDPLCYPLLFPYGEPGN